MIEQGKEKGYLLSDEIFDHLPDEISTQRQEVAAALLPSGEAEPVRRNVEVESAKPTEQEKMQSANALAKIAFVDILVFFGVLLVGYAYLWKRGDLDWVRSTAAERVVKMEERAQEPPPALLRPPLVGVGTK